MGKEILCRRNVWLKMLCFNILCVKLNSRCFSMKTKILFIAYGTLCFIQNIVLQKLRPFFFYDLLYGLFRYAINDRPKLSLKSYQSFEK